MKWKNYFIRESALIAPVSHLQNIEFVRSRNFQQEACPVQSTISLVSDTKEPISSSDEHSVLHEDMSS